MTARDLAAEAMLDEPENRYLCWRQLEDGTYVAVMRLMFTVALCIGVGAYTAYRRRYCYEDLGTALAEYQTLQTGDDEPWGWIARRPETAEDVEAKGQPNYDPSQFWPKRDEEV